jgi:putrescine aminotransferase
MNLTRVHETVRRHQSTGRSLLYAMTGTLDVEAGAKGAWVIGATGRRYLDLGSSTSFLLGHHDARVVAAVAAQLERLPVTSRVFPCEAQAQAVAAVADIAPSGLSKVMLLTSATEAAEAAAKLARAATSRALLFHLEGSYHGHTLGALSLSDAARVRAPFLPLLPQVKCLSRTESEAVVATIRSLRPAAVVVEPIQAEGGVFEVAVGYLRAVRAACDDAGALLVADETQCGLGRSGTLRALDVAEVVPDILLLGEALGGGVLPAAALVANSDVFSPYDQDPLLDGSTSGGNPLAAAAICATIAAVQHDRIPERAAGLGLRMRELLARLIRSRPQLFERVTGRGLMLGLHCRQQRIARRFVHSCLARGMLLTGCLSQPAVVRIAPPAVLQDADLRWAEEALALAARDTEEGTRE